MKIEFINDEEKCVRVIHEINMDPNEDLTNIDPQDFANEINYYYNGRKNHYKD